MIKMEAVRWDEKRLEDVGKELICVVHAKSVSFMQGVFYYLFPVI